MKKRLLCMLGLLAYIALLALLLRFDLGRMVQPMPLVSVLAGMAILTLSQYKKGMTWLKLLLHARWNAFVAGLLTSLLGLLSLLADGGAGMEALAERLIPLVYGSLFGLMLDLVLMPRESGKAGGAPAPAPQDLFAAETAQPVFANRGFSIRECHVALKLLEGRTNKEIAAQLYISEATVKKHIQNMFRKCGATDRQDFAAMYIRWAKGRNENGE